VCVAETTELITYFSNSKSGSPLSSLNFLREVPILPASCCINFSGSSSSSASTPASNGSSSNGLSLPFSFPNPLSSPNPPSPESASSNESNESPSSEAPKAGSLLGVSSFSLYLVSSSKL
jgi:hypothetical protein